MPASPINRITNGNVYLGGVNLLGRAEEVDLPQPKEVMVEHKGLGMWGKLKLPAGLDHLEASIKWASLYPEVLGSAFLPLTVANLMVRADMQQIGPQGVVAEVPVVAWINGVFSEMPGLKIVKHENSESPSKLAVYYYRLAIAGVDQVEIDVFANVYKVSGIDQLARYRANQGG
jgi:P2 family phage contractile tail tube protein